MRLAYMHAFSFFYLLFTCQAVLSFKNNCYCLLQQ